MNTKKYQSACERGLDWCLKYQQEDGSLRMPERCFDGIYKFPAAMQVMGRNSEAAKLLNWLEMTTLTPEGDLRFPEGKVVFDWHKNFYLYTNSWITIGAQRAGFFRIVEKSMGYILRYQSSETGAFQSGALGAGDEGLFDTTITGNCGIACLFTGRVSNALRAADALCEFAEQQDDQSIYYIRMDSIGKIIREVPEENTAWFCINSKKPRQCYWYVGISAALLLHCYEMTGNNRYLQNARRNLKFLYGCHEDSLNTFGSGKSGYASALAYRITGEKQYRKAALTFVDWLIKVQDPDGKWTMDEADFPWYLTWDITAEMVYWIKEITAILSAPKSIH